MQLRRLAGQATCKALMAQNYTFVVARSRIACEALAIMGGVVETLA